jgi:hypothetical protein
MGVTAIVQRYSRSPRVIPALPGVHQEKIYPEPKKIDPLITIDNETIMSAAARPTLKQVA